MDTVVDQGRCAVCGHVGLYVRAGGPTRENLRCEECGASLRYRLQAAAIAGAYGSPDASLADLCSEPSFRSLAIYEPGIIGPFRRFLRELPGYLNSYYWPDVVPGEMHEGVRCEDLHSLTLADESVDLVISSDIFEHVRHPMRAFAEVVRVLRPTGHHVFTVPLAWPLPSTTQPRVDCSGSEDVFLAPPQYHGSPTDPEGSLVYTDFGMDLPEELRGIGFETVVHHGYRQAVTFVSRKPPGAHGADPG